MSWCRRVEAYKFLESLAENPDTSLKEILDSQFIVQAASQRLPKLSLFLRKNLNQLIAYAVQKEKDKYSSISMEIITARMTLINELLAHDSDTIDYVVNYLNEDSDISAVLYILKYAINQSSGAVLFGLKRPKEVFSNLLQRIQYTSVFDFISSIFEMKYSSIREWVVENDIETIFLDHLTPRSLTCFELLLSLCLNDPTANRRMSNIKTIQSLLQAGIEDPQLRAKSFRIISNIFEYSEGQIKPSVDYVYRKYPNLYCKIMNLLFVQDLLPN